MLTPRQQQLLDFIAARARQSAVGPSVAEMALALGLSSPSSVHHLLVSLENRGYIRRAAHRARSITILPRPSPDAQERDNGFSERATLVGRIDLNVRLSALRRSGPTISIPPEIVAKGDLFALRIQSRQIHHDKLRGGDVCVFDRKSQPRPGDIALIRPARVDYAVLCSYIIKKTARIFEPIDPRSPHHALLAEDIQAVGTAVAVVRAI